MKKILSQYIKTTCDVVVDDSEVVKVLKVLDNHRIDANLKINKCGEWEGATKYSVMFRASGKQMTSIKSDLKKEEFREILILTNTNTWAKVEKL